MPDRFRPGTSVNTQINNTDLGMNSYGPGVQCASPQLAVITYTQGLRQADAGFGSNSTSNGVNVGFVAPLGMRSQRACQALADEILHQRQLDTQLTMIAKCGEFHKAGLVLDPAGGAQERADPAAPRRCAPSREHGSGRSGRRHHAPAARSVRPRSGYDSDRNMERRKMAAGHDGRGLPNPGTTTRRRSGRYVFHR